MVGAVFDTNILIDYLNAAPQAEAEYVRYGDRAVSIVTWIEVLVGTTPAKEAATRRFLERFELIDLDDDVAEKAVLLRRTHRLKLPDAVIWASAQVRGLLLITRNTKDYPKGDPGIRMPYVV